MAKVTALSGVPHLGVSLRWLRQEIVVVLDQVRDFHAVAVGVLAGREARNRINAHFIRAEVLGAARSCYRYRGARNRSAGFVGHSTFQLWGCRLRHQQHGEQCQSEQTENRCFEFHVKFQFLSYPAAAYIVGMPISKFSAPPI